MVHATADLADNADDVSAEDLAGEAPEIRQCEVDQAWHGERLDKVLVRMAPEFSRSHLQSLIERSCVQVQGEVADTASRKVRAGQVVRLELQPTEESRAFRAEALPLD
ncbi:MAG: RluA family pseudouridine synthase, partial [Paucibacter sp.]|nr:RluA family pseudouridine synthase [Roseateles sp.]